MKEFDQEILYRYIIGEVSSQEREQVEAWLNHDKEALDLFIRLKNTIAFSGESSHITDNQIMKGYRDLKPVGNSKQGKKIVLWLSRVAVVFALLFTVSWGSYYMGKRGNREVENLAQVPRFLEVVCPKGQITELTLTDGSHVILNSGTTLKVPEFFVGKIRKVFLKGEGLFEVHSNPDRPFIVETSQMNVRATGTVFNVSAYEEDEKVITTLLEGKVSLENSYGHILATLNPGEQGRMNFEGDMGIKKVRAEYYDDWKDGFILLDNYTLGEIQPIIERIYNVKISFTNPSLRDIRIRGRIIRNSPIDQLFEVLRFSTGINYKIKAYAEKPSEILIQ